MNSRVVLESKQHRVVEEEDHLGTYHLERRTQDRMGVERWTDVEVDCAWLARCILSTQGFMVDDVLFPLKSSINFIIGDSGGPLRLQFYDVLLVAETTSAGRGDGAGYHRQGRVRLYLPADGAPGTWVRVSRHGDADEWQAWLILLVRLRQNPDWFRALARSTPPAQDTEMAAYPLHLMDLERGDKFEMYLYEGIHQAVELPESYDIGPNRTSATRELERAWEGQRRPQLYHVGKDGDLLYRPVLSPDGRVFFMSRDKPVRRVSPGTEGDGFPAADLDRP